MFTFDAEEDLALGPLSNITLSRYASLRAEPTLENRPHVYYYCAMFRSLAGLIVFLFFVSHLAQAQTESPSQQQGDFNSQTEPARLTDASWVWHGPAAEVQPNAVVLIVHGLNLLPQKMKGLRDVMLAQGAQTMTVTLSGHGGDLEEMKRVTRRQWLRDLGRGYDLARARADELHVPLYFVGYSLGALIGVDLLTHSERTDVHYDKAILIAPALAVKRTTKLVKILSIMGDGFILPSANYVTYRANRGTSVAAYKALFESMDRVNARSLEKLRDVPALVFADPKDEMVSYSGLKELRADKNLRLWKFQPIDNSYSLLPKKYHHLMIDYVSVGPDNWNLMRQRMIDFYQQK